MEQYKRNQVEQAIAAALQQAEREPDANLRTRLKRLLDTDHMLGQEGRGSDPARAYAFSAGSLAEVDVCRIVAPHEVTMSPEPSLPQPPQAVS